MAVLEGPGGRKRSVPRRQPVVMIQPGVVVAGGGDVEQALQAGRNAGQGARTEVVVGFPCVSRQNGSCHLSPAPSSFPQPAAGDAAARSPKLRIPDRTALVSAASPCRPAGPNADTSTNSNA